jgi:hypothetical protein
MANLKTKKTAAGAQQYSAPGKTKALQDKLDKDITRVHDKIMTREDFKKKYGMTILKAQSMIYAAEAADSSKRTKYPTIKRLDDKYEKDLVRERKEMERSGIIPKGMNKGGMTKKKMGYNKGGYCGASNPAARPMKKGK